MIVYRCGPLDKFPIPGRLILYIVKPIMDAGPGTLELGAGSSQAQETMLGASITTRLSTRRILRETTRQLTNNRQVSGQLWRAISVDPVSYKDCSANQA
jgi:hypothetical protein